MYYDWNYRNGLCFRNKTKFFDGTNISYIYKTKNNNYWISTLTEGLFYIEDFDTQFISSKESLTSLCFKNEQLIGGTKNDKILALEKISLKPFLQVKTTIKWDKFFMINFQINCILLLPSLVF